MMSFPCLTTKSAVAFQSVLQRLICQRPTPPFVVKHALSSFVADRGHCLYACRNNSHISVRTAHSITRRNAANVKLNKKTEGMVKKCLYVKSVVPRGEMSADNWSFCLKAIASLTKADDVNEDDLRLAQSLLDRICEEQDLDQSACTIPGTNLAAPYIQIMRGWARTRLPESLDHCSILFEQMNNRHQNNPQKHPNPHSKHVYSALLYACGLSTHSNARDIADSWMKAFEAQAISKKTHLPVEIYNQIILVHAQKAANEYGAAADAEDWLVHLSKFHTEGGPAPTTESFNRVLRAWSQSPENFAVNRAQVILNLMLQLQKDHEHVQPDVNTFATILLACARHGQPEQAEELWRETVDYFERRNNSVDLSNCFNATTLAWSKSNSPEAVEKIEQLLLSCPRGSESTQVSIKNIGESITNLLSVMVRHNQVRQADERLRHFWQEHLQFNGPRPLPGSLHFVIRSYEQSDILDRAQLATDLLLHAVELGKNHPSVPVPDTATFNLCMQMCLKQNLARSVCAAVLDAAESTKCASVYTYSLMINALCKDKTVQSTYEALSILKRLEEADSNPQCQIRIRESDIGLYTAVLTALSSCKTPEAADECYNLFNQIDSSRRWRTSTRMYTSVLFSLRLKGKSGRRRAFALFKSMVEREKNDQASRIKLDVFVFQTLFRVLLKDGDAEAAKLSMEAFLTMLKMHDEGRKDLMPNLECLDTCLLSMASSGDATLVRAGSRLLREIRKRHDCGKIPILPSKHIVKLLQRET